MLINKTADKLVFAFLSKIKNGFLEITTHDGKILKFGDPDQSLKANIKIKNPNLNYCLLYTSPSPRDGLLSRMPSSA